MTKEQIRENLDRIFKQHMNYAIDMYEKNFRPVMVIRELEVCYGILFSASTLEIIDSEEFNNINHTLAYTSIRW